VSGRGKQNSPNTRHPERPPRKPGRLDQFADNGREELSEELNLTDKPGHRRVRAVSVSRKMKNDKT